MTVKVGENSAVARMRQEAKMLADSKWKTVSGAFGDLLLAVAVLAFWLGQTLGEMSESRRAEVIAQFLSDVLLLHLINWLYGISSSQTSKTPDI